MRNTKLVAGLSVTALAALGVTAFVITNNTAQNIAKDTKAENVQVEADASIEYTGNAFVSSSLLSALLF